MSSQQSILLSCAERNWTSDALAYACKLAGSQNVRIVLVQCVPVNHPEWLGTEWAYMNYTAEQERNLDWYQKAATSAGIECDSLVMPYVSLVPALAQVADEMGATLVLARLPWSFVPFWRALQKWILQRHLAKEGRRWLSEGFDAPVS